MHLFHIPGLICVELENIRALGFLQSLCILVASFSPFWRARKNNTVLIISYREYLVHKRF